LSVALRLVQHPRFGGWLAGLPSAIAVATADGVTYLCEHGRGAVLPDVRHRIQTSQHYPDMSEVRVDKIDDGRRYAVRVLTCFVDDDRTLLVCVGGDKEGYEARTGRDWYDDYVPVADHVVVRYLAKGGRR
jgi:hypothetical protein